MTPRAAPRPVLLVVRPAAGGIRAHVAGLLERVDTTLFTLSVAAPRSFLDTLPPATLAAARRYPLAIGARTGPADVTAALRLAALVRSYPQPPLVHAHGVRAGLVAALARGPAAFRLVVTYHNVPPSGRAARWALRFLQRRADAAVAVSQAIAQALPPGRLPVAVIPNGVDPAALRPPSSPQERADAKRRLGLAPDRLVAATVARLSPEKGVDLLVQVAADCPAVTFLVAGDGPQRAALERQAPPNLRFLGYVPDTAPLLAAADMAVVPSRSEGQGIVALEAMAVALPVAAFAVGGLVETITDGMTGLLAPAKSVRELASVVRRLGGDLGLRARLGAAGLAWVREFGDAAQRTREVEAVYEFVVNSNGPQA